MGQFLVAGIINVETTVKVPSIPVEYMPALDNYFEIDSGVSGNGFNVAKALAVLGDDVTIVSMIGEDYRADVINSWLESEGFHGDYILTSLKATPKSVVLYDNDGKRQIFYDLKDSIHALYDMDMYLKAVQPVDLVMLGNTNFCKPFLKITKDVGKKIATSVHAVSDIYDIHNSDFMKYADILFLSDDNLSESPYDFVKRIAAEYDNEIIILGRGGKGAMLYVKDDQFIGKFPAVKTREIINTVGAGDALLSAFLHFYLKTGNPYVSIKSAILFSSYKIGTAGSSNGFLTEEQLEQYYSIIWK